LVWSGTPKLDEGRVVGMRYEPANTQVMMMPVVISNGRTTTTMIVPYYIYDDEDWVLTVTGTLENGKQRTEDWYISRSAYESLEIGDEVCTTDCGASRNDPHRKERK
jgi:hypothetical protein